MAKSTSRKSNDKRSRWAYLVILLAVLAYAFNQIGARKAVDSEAPMALQQT